jgi:hypothetical protein
MKATAKTRVIAGEKRIRPNLHMRLPPKNNANRSTLGAKSACSIPLP